MLNSNCCNCDFDCFLVPLYCHYYLLLYHIHQILTSVMYMLYNPRALLSIFLASSFLIHEKRKTITYYRSADIESQVMDTFQCLQCVKEEISNT